jgi:hypothetical protein
MEFNISSGEISPLLSASKMSKISLIFITSSSERPGFAYCFALKASYCFCGLLLSGFFVAIFAFDIFFFFFRGWGSKK